MKIVMVALLALAACAPPVRSSCLVPDSKVASC